MRYLFIPLLFLTISAQAQKLILKANISQNIPLAGQSMRGNMPISGDVSYSSTTGELSTFDVEKASFGAGLFATIGAGITAGKNAEIELNGIIALNSKKYAGTLGQPYDANIYVSEVYKMQATSIVLLNPMLKIQTGGDNYKFYLKAGPVLPLSIKFTGTFSGRYADLAHRDYTYGGTQQYKTSFSLGLAGALGVSYNLGKKALVFLEGNFTSMSIYVKSRTTTEYNENGTDQLNKINAADRSVSFAKDSKAKGTLSKNIYPTFSLPFSSAGISFGTYFIM